LGLVVSDEGKKFYNIDTRSRLNGSDVQLIVSEDISQPDGVAVDWIGRNIFWIDTGNDRIEVSRLDGSSRKILISRDLDEPRDIALDPINGWMYWSDWGENAQIERSWMDGTHRSVVVSEDVGWPNGIAVDVELQHLYFCDAKRDRIEMVNADGSGRRIIVGESLQHPFGLSVLGDYIYWTDWERNTVERADKLTGQGSVVLLENNENLMSVETVNTRPNPKWSNKCLKNNGGCSHLCIVVPQSRVCECPNGLEISGVSGVSCVVPEAFLLYTRKSEIGRVSISTPNHNGYVLPIKGLLSIDGLTL
jgi:low density lipoprotein receptor-related protein 5/6